MAPTDRPSLGELIRRQRELNELSLRQLARIVGISNPYLSQIERGLREPSDNVLEGIARSLKLPVDDLYERMGVAQDDVAGDEAAVISAIREDPQLTARQRQALIEVYEAFVATGARQRRRRRRTEG
ncbi:MAG TPA: helix-turn-helix transcriptional regulator [Solirubrobacteraceae bacterium]|jgi:transcriptional regulator with XRE-family HTH domain